MKIKLLFFIFCFLPTYSILFSQSIVTELKSFKYQNGYAVFYVCKLNPKNDIIDDLEYYWYNEYSGVQKTKGGIGGQLLHGKYQFFNSKGNLIQESNYYLGLEDGFHRIWDDQGKIVETMKSNRGVAVYMKYIDDNDVIIEWIGELFKTGSIKNVYTSYNKLIEKSTCIEPYKFHTLIYFEDYSDKNILSMEFTGFGDYYDGEYKVFFQNGNLKLKGIYDENFKTDQWVWYNEDGTIKVSLKYRIFIDKYPNGNLKTKGSEFYDVNSSSWKPDGTWIHFSLNGKDWDKVEKYDFGEIVD